MTLKSRFYAMAAMLAFVMLAPLSSTQAGQLFPPANATNGGDSSNPVVCPAGLTYLSWNGNQVVCSAPAPIVYSQTCRDWQSLGFPSESNCLQDGRWHLVFTNGPTGAVTYGSINNLAYAISTGADVKIASSNNLNDADGISELFCTHANVTNNVAYCFRTFSWAGNILAPASGNDLGTALWTSQGIISNAQLTNNAEDNAYVKNAINTGDSNHTTMNWYIKY